MLSLQYGSPRLLPDLHPDDRLAAEAFCLYERARDQGDRKRLWARLRKRSRSLCSLSDIVPQQIKNRHAAGTRAVPLDQIMGSSGRTSDFDHDFYPLRNSTEKRWVWIATAFLRGDTLPPVELVQVGDVYYVLDGHHRISVARMLHHTHIDALVTVWETNN